MVGISNSKMHDQLILAKNVFFPALCRWGKCENDRKRAFQYVGLKMVGISYSKMHDPMVFWQKCKFPTSTHRRWGECENDRRRTLHCQVLKNVRNPLSEMHDPLILIRNVFCGPLSLASWLFWFQNGKVRDHATQYATQCQY